MTEKVVTLMQHIDIIVDVCAREILKYTPQLYLLKEESVEGADVKPYASGVLISHDNNYFLITAGHVVEDIDPTRIGIMIGNVFNILNGEIKYFKPSFSTELDKIDVAIWKLENEIVKELEPHYKFLTIEKFGMNHKLIQDDPRFLIVGYPWRKSKLNPLTQKIKVKVFVFLTKNSKKEIYKQLKLEEFSNIILEYKQRKIRDFNTGLITKGVTPEGISGCGAWYIPNFIIDPSKTPDFKLISIVTEQDKSKKHLKTTRIDIITEVLRRDFKIQIIPSNLIRLT